MDELDYQILDVLQDDFPLSERPYEVIANRLGISCDELWDRICKLISAGVIRRIGASLDSRALGFCSTLAAVRVKAESIERAAEIISRFPEVTHSYLRKDDFNIWFTIIAPEERRISEVLEEIGKALSVESSDILHLPMERLFKLDTRFKSRR
jgi:DNA-binding Lrp family transcriptional regulator